MTKKNTTTTQLTSANNADALIDAIIFGLEEVKAHDIVVMDLRKLAHASTDFFIICHGNTGTQVKALCQSVEKHAYLKANETPLHIEGEQNAKWILMDFGNVVVHIFDKEARDYYELEELWADAEVSKISAQHVNE
ncbi:MAG TPA: ribosome silencing factor [Flavobacteriales bacterium]